MVKRGVSDGWSDNNPFPDSLEKVLMHRRGQLGWCGGARSVCSCGFQGHCAFCASVNLLHPPAVDVVGWVKIQKSSKCKFFHAVLTLDLPEFCNY